MSHWESPRPPGPAQGAGSTMSCQEELELQSTGARMKQCRRWLSLMSWGARAALCPSVEYGPGPAHVLRGTHAGCLWLVALGGSVAPPPYQTVRLHPPAAARKLTTHGGVRALVCCCHFCCCFCCCCSCCSTRCSQASSLSLAPPLQFPGMAPHMCSRRCEARGLWSPNQSARHHKGATLHAWCPPSPTSPPLTARARGTLRLREVLQA